VQHKARKKVTTANDKNGTRDGTRGRMAHGDTAQGKLKKSKKKIKKCFLTQKKYEFFFGGGVV